jgi:hypothetical protein
MAIIDTSVASIMRRSVVEYRIVLAYSLTIRPDSGRRVKAENMQVLLRPEDASTMSVGQALGRGLANVFQNGQTVTDAFASIAMSIPETRACPQ